jgi:hypothetical protein
MEFRGGLIIRQPSAGTTAFPHESFLLLSPWLFFVPVFILIHAAHDDQDAA